MSKHTPEPWAVDEYMAVGGLTGMLIDNAGNHIGTAFNVTMSAEAVTNARRIVTCVNACAGMADPAAEIAELKRQRDELLASLHDAATSLETIQLRSFGADSYLDDKHSMRTYAGARAKVAREAMDKAKGSAS